MPTAVVGLLSAFVYGAADFVGGVASRRLGPIRVTAIGAVAGLLLLLVAWPLVGGQVSPAAVAWGATSGLVGTAAISLLYACLAIGPMSILSPLTALVSALVPMAWGLLGGDRFAPIGYLALGLALVAVVLVGFVPEKGAIRPSVRALLMATAAGALIGVFLIMLDQTPDDSGVVPLIANRTVNGAVMWSVVALLAIRARARARSREEAVAVGTGRPTRASAPAPSPEARASLASRWTLVAATGGLLDASANALILIGLRLGDLTTMSVLVALYPAGTILLAAAVLRERVAPVQWVGLVLAVVAAALLAVS